MSMPFLWRNAHMQAVRHPILQGQHYSTVVARDRYLSKVSTVDSTATAGIYMVGLSDAEGHRRDLILADSETC